MTLLDVVLCVTYDGAKGSKQTEYINEGRVKREKSMQNKIKLFIGIGLLSITLGLACSIVLVTSGDDSVEHYVDGRSDKDFEKEEPTKQPKKENYDAGEAVVDQIMRGVGVNEPKGAYHAMLEKIFCKEWTEVEDYEKKSIRALCFGESIDGQCKVTFETDEGNRRSVQVYGEVGKMCSYFKVFSELRELDCADNRIEDPNFLKKLKKLKKLSINLNLSEVKSYVACPKRLETLVIGGDLDCSGKYFPNLKELSACYNHEDKPYDLRQHPKLEIFRMGEDEEAPKCIFRLKNLKELEVGYVGKCKLSKLAKLQSLSVAYVQNKKSAEEIGNCKGLKVLRIGAMDTSVNAKAFEGLVHLESLTIHDSFLENLQFLREMKQVKTIDVRGCKIDDCDYFMVCSSVRNLICDEVAEIENTIDEDCHVKYEIPSDYDVNAWDYRYSAEGFEG